MLFDAGTFDEDDIEDIYTFYTLDMILEETAKPISYNLDAYLANFHNKSYLMDVAPLERMQAQSSYLLSALLVLDRSDPRFQESVINAIIHSFGRAFEDLSMAIDLMGLRLQLPYATTDDLDIYWAPILGLRRRSNESDGDYRRRLTTRLSIMKSSGTTTECEAILNNILGMRNAVRLDTYWPAEVRVCWNSYTAMRQAEARYAILSETLNSMLAAGVSWSTSFPYKIYTLDANLSGKHSTDYSLDAGLEKEKWAMYLMRADMFGQNTIEDSMDACLEVPHTKNYTLDTRLWAEREPSYPLDGLLSIAHTKTYTMDGLIRQNRSASYSLDALASEDMFYPYDLDAFAEKSRRGFYMLTVELVAA